MRGILLKHICRDICKKMIYAVGFAVYYIAVTYMAGFIEEYSIGDYITSLLIFMALAMIFLVATAPSIPKAFFILPISRNERKKYVKSLINIKYGVLMTVTLVTEVIIYFYDGLNFISALCLIIGVSTIFYSFSTWQYVQYFKVDSFLVLADVFFIITGIVLYTIMWGSGSLLVADKLGFIVLLSYIVLLAVEVIVLRKHRKNMIELLADYEENDRFIKLMKNDRTPYRLKYDD